MNSLSIVIDQVEKMLKRCKSGGGFATYICTSCGATKVIPFSCKSKLCSRCGKKHTDIWAHILSEKLLFCEHRHIILTVSDKLWGFFIDNLNLQKLLLNTAAKIIKKVFNYKHKMSVGFIMVLHPFGDDLKANFHVHILVSCGGLSEDDSRFIKVGYIDYDFIRKTWQYEILSALRTALPEKQHILQPIIDWCFRYRNKGFVIFADSVVKGPQKDVLKYIARYTKHPAISTRRILDYDGSYVTFSYESYGKQLIKKMPKFEFIKAVLIHVSSKHFKTIRRFGLYSRRSSKKFQIAESLPGQSDLTHSPYFNWRKNVTSFTKDDPLLCPQCKGEMELFSITYFDKFGNRKSIQFNDWFYDEPQHSQPLRISNNETKTKERQIYLLKMQY